MTLQLDHVIIAVHDLAAAIADYRALGFTVHPGGRHSMSTSHNALVVFADGAYFELIAWPQPDPAHRWFNVLAKHGEGLMDFALIPDDVPRAIEAARSRGLALNGPIDGGRVRTDGMELKWKTGRQTTFDLPFLCGDITPREGRVPEGDIRRHANGAAGIATLGVAVLDIEASVARYRALLGEEAGTPVTLPGLGVRAAIVRLAGTDIVLMAPSVEAPSCPFVRELQERLATRGEGPCAVAIRAKASARLDPRYTHGVVAEFTA
ncbi:MAG TPA: VOC family protein [Usitatibacter sp.]|nr:VOC family protein [Usitatibacter sp.]